VGKKQDKALLTEANRIRYRLRSTFFLRKLKQYHTHELLETIHNLTPQGKRYDWKDCDEWGVSKRTFRRISTSKVSLIQVFSHPKLLRKHPFLVAYYRNIAALSQKSVRYLSGISPTGFESGEKKDMTLAQARALSRLFNEHISLIIDDAAEELDDEDLKGLLFASTGAQIDGSWRNAIGIEAERAVLGILYREAIGLDQVADLRNGQLQFGELGDTEDIDQRNGCEELRCVTLKNKRSILFSSDPDISLIDSDGSTIAAIEVKGGTDPAGALERYGAAKKSFEEDSRKNKRTVTVLVASCITPEVEKRIKKDRTIKKYFNLTAILTEERAKKKFLDYIFKNLLKC